MCDMKRIFLTLGILSCSLFTLVKADIPAGYYSTADGKKDAKLKSAMSEIISPHTRIDYGAKGTWSVFRTSDVREDGTIWDMYSDVVRYFPESGSHPDMHIEHSVPKSWWGEQSTFVYEASFDIHHLVPSDASANMSKSNNILGEVTTTSFDNGVSKVGSIMIGDKKLSAFEPADEYKGDFARMYMYVITCYQDYTWMSDGVYMFNSESYPTLNAYASDLLMRWHRNDPVSQKEIDRNEAVYAAQSNRNPFIDYPLLAEYLWGDSIGRTFSTDLSDSPYLITPSSSAKVDMGTVMTGATLDYDLAIEGRNISAPLQLSWRKDVGIKLSDNTLSADNVNAGTSVTLSYTNSALTDVLRDTLIISGGGLMKKQLLPIELRGTDSFIPLSPIDVTSTSATLRWVAMPDAQSYSVELYEGASEATDLFVSAYVEGSSYNKAIALYNGTSHSIRLSDYALGRQHNGAGEWVDYYKLPNKTLASGDTYILVNSQCSNDELRAYADYFVPAGENSPLNFNGNDAVALYHNNILIDVVGEVNVIDNWGKDVTLYRSYATLGPSTTFKATQWTQAATDDFASLRSHKMTSTTDNATLLQSIETTETTAYVNGLQPSTVYLYKVVAKVGNTHQEALYACVFTTLDLSAPADINVDNIYDVAFRLSWDAVEGVDGYEVDCFTLVGSGSVTQTEGFDNVGSKGTPLPDGWSGTASGNYTSAASSGTTPPSVALKSTGEYIQTPTYPYPITELSFMYRFASAATGSSLKVSCLKGDEWHLLEQIEFVNTTKATYNCTFEREDNVRAFRWEYDKVSGNMAIDDVTVTYGGLDTLYVAREQYESHPNATIDNLKPLTTYYYRVRSALKDSHSPWSNIGCVTTTEYTHLTDTQPAQDITIVQNCDGVRLLGVPHSSVVMLYDIQGRLYHSEQATSTSVYLPIEQQGIYIIKVVNEEKSSVIKIVFSM